MSGYLKIGLRRTPFTNPASRVFKGTLEARVPSFYKEVHMFLKENMKNVDNFLKIIPTARLSLIKGGNSHIKFEKAKAKGVMIDEITKRENEFYCNIAKKYHFFSAPYQTIIDDKKLIEYLMEESA